MKSITSAPHRVIAALAGALLFTSGSLLACAEAAPGYSVSDAGADWADVLTAPRHYLRTARRAVDHRHYRIAARNLRAAATMVAHHEGYAVGRERRRLRVAAQALRLTAKDVAAGAVTSSMQLDGVLNDTHRDLVARGGLDRKP
jgi:hypothetical protein